MYGGILLMAGIACYILRKAILASEGSDSLLAAALGHDWKGKLSPVIYTAAIPVAFVSPWLAASLYAIVAGIWLIPDRRIEHEFAKRDH